ncbi:hypothetical protein LINPERPRIM_LOCUS1278 [Linum perenne]
MRSSTAPNPAACSMSSTTSKL